MTEPDIDHAVKEILGARVDYLFAFLHLARWISVRNNSELKEKIVSLIGWIPTHFAFLNLRSKNSTGKKTLGADTGVTFQEFFT